MCLGKNHKGPWKAKAWCDLPLQASFGDSTDFPLELVEAQPRGAWIK